MKDGQKTAEPARAFPADHRQVQRVRAVGATQRDVGLAELGQLRFEFLDLRAHNITTGFQDISNAPFDFGPKSVLLRVKIDELLEFGLCKIPARPVGAGV